MMFRRRWNKWEILGLFVPPAVAVALVVVTHNQNVEPTDTPYEPVERAQVNGRILGDPSAPVRIVMVEDFQCPFCRAFTQDTEPQLIEEFVETGVASIEYRHLAFLGEESTRAAEAAECAADQGHFWDYHDILFLRQNSENHGAFADEHLRAFARELATALPGAEFDLVAFDDCLMSGEKRAFVEQLSAETRELLVEVAGRAATPTVLVNGQPINGLSPIEDYRRVVAAAQVAVAEESPADSSS